MEFSEKLQQLRTSQSLTQEQLAEKLYVSRTAVSKWESGRGYPSIDSLKAISNYFSVSIDELLSGEELMQAAEEDKKEDSLKNRMLMYGLLDVMNLLFFFIPLFGEPQGDEIVSTSLLAQHTASPYVFVGYVTILTAVVLLGVVEIIWQRHAAAHKRKICTMLSMLLTVLAISLFIMSQQPYLAFFELWILVIKGILYWKHH